MEKRIKEVLLHFPMSEDCSFINYEVGEKGVTEIRETGTSPVPHCEVKHYEIYQGDKLYAELHHFSQVIYF